MSKHGMTSLYICLLQVPSVCRCANNTAGEHCENCLPNFNNAPWRSGFDPMFTGCQGR